MAHKIGGNKTAPARVKFSCPKTGDWVTEGDEPIVQFEEREISGHQTSTTSGMKCPGCTGFIKFDESRDGITGIHTYSA
jgi:hypothetical protein